MEDITKNEMKFMLTLLKNPNEQYNANNISTILKISSMGALKIAKRLQKENIFTSKEIGKATFYKLNLESDYVRQYLKFLLKREAEQASPYVKRWKTEVEKKLESISIVVILFGSILTKQKGANDIDLLIIIDKKKYNQINKKIEEINKFSDKTIHPMYQTKKDFKENLEKEDKPLMSAIKGIVLSGEEQFLELLK
ncbi:hypothetical protein HOD20_00130 [archaeon]|jgi:predicted nucleotidyltransferase|nr:hypothetical protein [archaeon]MBT4350909.1 hypothetical protein [archaeon]MBT4646959.1 hypothetical protein [archaeon]MBT6821675.1 hypothetical protein [archaeon]MBT7392206.1 hypothetical protein [archaeon]